MGAVTAGHVQEARWRCPRCDRAFQRTGQQHSCRTVGLEEHLGHSDATRTVFDRLLAAVTSQIGACEVVTLPCCIHLSGRYDFLAVLPRKGRLEIRFALRREAGSPRIKRATQISRTMYKHSVDLAAEQEIDDELLGWLREAYHLKDT